MFIDSLLFVSAIIILIASIVLSVKTRFVQLRMLPYMIKSLFSGLTNKSNQNGDMHTILPHKALFTAMSTTLGISTMISPVIAIQLGGPGALIGYLLTTLLGSAATYTEVNFAVAHRKKLASGKFMGGPMQYLEDMLSPKMAKWYAFFCLLLMAAWSGAQSNQLAAILASDRLGSFSIPLPITGLLLATLVITILIGGIKRVAEFSSKIVPVMFGIYISAVCWILFSNIEKIPDLISLVVQSALSPYQLATGSVVGGLTSALRWGTFKGIHSNEAALGTQTIPNSMAMADPVQQGVLAMASTYTAGIVAILSGFTALISNTWQDPHLGLGINMVAATFEIYFANIGFPIILICALLFGIGTALGNSYNGGHCFEYLTKNRYSTLYFILSAVIIFIGAISDVSLFWGWSDVVLALVAAPHACALVLISYKKSRIQAAEQLENALLQTS